MNRPTMNRSITGCYLDCFQDKAFRDRSHRNNHGTLKDASRLAGDINDIHRYGFVFLNVPDRDFHFQERLFKGMAAAEQK